MNEITTGPSRLRKQGVYLITGGLGGVGFVVAEYLAKTVQAKLVLIGRSSLPDREEWERWLATHGELDRTSRKIAKILELERLGAEVLVDSADVSDELDMRTMIAKAEQRFGRLNGAMHLAGVSGEQTFRTIREATKIECEDHFRPKVYGLSVLHEALRGREIDFCLVFSSLASVLGGLGFVAYSAANLYMDAFVIQHGLSSGVEWTSVNWDGWRVRDETGQVLGTTSSELAMTSQEGITALQHILSLRGVRQVVVSAGNLHKRIDQWVKLESLRQGDKTKIGSETSHHPRPKLSTPYVAPGNEVEEAVAAVLRDLLGTEQVGAHDNFFELGGDSLLGIQVISRIREFFKVELPLRALFEAPTVAGISLAIVEAGASEAGNEILARMLDEIEQMPDEDARRMLVSEAALDEEKRSNHG